MIEPITFSYKLLAPPMDFPFGLNSGGSIFGAGRPSTHTSLREGDKYYGCHTGIDLFPKPKGPLPEESPPHKDSIYAADWGTEESPPHKDSIYAADWGTVESVVNHNDPSDPDYDPNEDDWEILIQHHPHSSGVYTLYRHLHSVEPHIQPNAEVNVGEIIGRIDGSADNPHLHFMWALKTDLSEPFIGRVRRPSPGPGSRSARIFNCVPLDPTPQLYRFEAFRWPSVSGKLPRRHLPKYSKIRQIRVTHWYRSPVATWLFEVEMPKENNPQESDYFYLPINDALPHEKLMADIIRDSFHKGNNVKLSWHDSYFYGERKMIDDVRVKP